MIQSAYCPAIYMTHSTGTIQYGFNTSVGDSLPIPSFPSAASTLVDLNPVFPSGLLNGPAFIIAGAQTRLESIDGERHGFAIGQVPYVWSGYNSSSTFSTTASYGECRVGYQPLDHLFVMQAGSGATPGPNYDIRTFETKCKSASQLIILGRRRLDGKYDVILRHAIQLAAVKYRGRWTIYVGKEFPGITALPGGERYYAGLVDKMAPHDWNQGAWTYASTWKGYAGYSIVDTETINGVWASVRDTPSDVVAARMFDYGDRVDALEPPGSSDTTETFDGSSDATGVIGDIRSRATGVAESLRGLLWFLKPFIGEV